MLVAPRSMPFRNPATSETARWLAESENRADLIGGVGRRPNDKDDVLAEVFLTSR